jgi:hypothetical protein
MGNSSENAMYFEAALSDREVREYEVEALWATRKNAAAFGLTLL